MHVMFLISSSRQKLKLYYVLRPTFGFVFFGESESMNRQVGKSATITNCPVAQLILVVHYQRNRKNINALTHSRDHNKSTVLLALVYFNFVGLSLK